MSTWIDKQGLYLRYGQEFIDKLAIRRDFDCEANDGDGGYIANETRKRLDCIINVAIEDAKEWILWKISSCYSIVEFNKFLDEEKDFSFIKRFHIKLTITMLKFGGDCKECDDCKEELSEICSTKEICTDDGICIPSKKKSVFAVESTAPSCLPTSVCCGCDSHRCACGS